MGEFSRALGMADSFKFARAKRKDGQPIKDSDGKVLREPEKEYKLSPIGFEVIALWEQYLERRAFGAIERRRARAIKDGNFNPGAFAGWEQDLYERIAAGKYSFFSQVSTDAQTNFLSDGWRNMVLIRLQVLQPDVTMDLVDEMVEDMADQLERLMRKQDTPDPNSPSPAATTPGDESEPKPSSPDSAKTA